VFALSYSSAIYAKLNEFSPLTFPFFCSNHHQKRDKISPRKAMKKVIKNHLRKLKFVDKNFRVGETRGWETEARELGKICQLS